jgi:hypothetical protein
MKFKEFDVPLIRIDISEWGIDGHSCAFVRELTTAEHSELVSILFDKTESKATDLQRQATAVVRFALDAEGKRLFTDDDFLDIVNHSSKPARRITEALFAANNTATEMKELEKN